MARQTTPAPTPASDDLEKIRAAIVALDAKAVDVKAGSTAHDQERAVAADRSNRGAQVMTRNLDMMLNLWCHRMAADVLDVATMGRYRRC